MRMPLGSPRASRTIFPPSDLVCRARSGELQSTRIDPHRVPVTRSSITVGRRSRCRVRSRSDTRVAAKTPDPPDPYPGRWTRPCRRVRTRCRIFNLREPRKIRLSNSSPRNCGGRVRRREPGVQCQQHSLARRRFCHRSHGRARSDGVDLPSRTATASARGCDVSSVMKLPTIFGPEVALAVRRTRACRARRIARMEQVLRGPTPSSCLLLILQPSTIRSICFAILPTPTSCRFRSR